MNLSVPGTLIVVAWLFCMSCGIDSKRHYFAQELTADSPVVAPKTAQTAFGLADFYLGSRGLDSIVQGIFDGLTLKEKAAQLIMDASSEVETANLPFTRAKKLYSDTIIGGLLFLKGKKAVIEKYIKELDALTAPGHAGKLLYSCDCEPTLFNQKIINTDPVKAAILLKDTGEVRDAATRIAGTIKQMGIQINFAPVTDIALNKKAINRRSFSYDPADIIEKSSTFVEFTQVHEIASCLKHFPGHGAVEGDSHKGQVVIDGEPSELNTFKSVILNASPVMVMVGHMTIKNSALYETAGKPCSVSRKIVTDLLKDELGYKGIVITDAMRMSALDNTPDADWKAILAGADIVLIPRNPTVLNQKIINGLSVNNKLKLQLETSVKKVLRLKVCCGRYNWRTPE